MRVLARDHDEVDDGWLCDKGRFAYQAMHVDERITAPAGPRRRRAARGRLGPRAGRGRGGAGPRAREGRARSSAARRPTRRATCSRSLVRDGLGLADVESRAAGGPSARAARARWTIPTCRRPSRTSSSPTRCSCSTPSPSTTCRSSTCACARACAATTSSSRVATSRPSSLDANAATVARFAPGAGEAFLAALNAALGGGGVVSELAAGRGHDRAGDRDIAALLGRRGRRDPLRRAAAERPARRPRGARAAQRRRRRASTAATTAPGCWRSRPARTAAACARSAAPSERSPCGDRRRPRPPATLTALYLLHIDPAVELPTATGSRRWSARPTVIAHAMFLTPGIAEHATVVFPSRVLGRARGHDHAPRRPPAAPAPGGRPRRRRARVLAGARGARQAPRRWIPASSPAPMATTQHGRARPDLRRHHARRDRRPRRALAGARRRLRRTRATSTSGRSGSRPRRRASARPAELRFATFRSIWGGPEVAASPALKFLASRPRVLLSPADAQRLELFEGMNATVAPNGGEAIEATVARARGGPEGTAFLESDVAGVVGTAGVRKAERRCSLMPRSSPPSTTTSPGTSRSSRRS